ncbi:MAG: GNAT family N-acetyltransferase [Synechococcaceae cyanobacterium RM1_1_27]|nr:GNAT family N-acetyltransferase [Synechococcaceae cyanobacterium SM2_3_2]NJO86496.1 GNAT family N-acetyltransferase [Synechococcaceae cyanobacterium RM1_1_27]
MGFWRGLFGSPESGGVGTVVKEEVLQQQPERIFFTTNADLDLYELEELCDAVGWSRRPIHKVRKALQHSFLVVAMWQQQGTYKRLIGFARATSDHAFNATLWDVVVHPDCQGKGYGRALMDKVIRELRSQDISNITLFADRGVVEFYERLGFTPDPEGIKGMFWYPSR